MQNEVADRQRLEFITGRKEVLPDDPPPTTPAAQAELTRRAALTHATQFTKKQVRVGVMATQQIYSLVGLRRFGSDFFFGTRLTEG